MFKEHVKKFLMFTIVGAFSFFSRFLFENNKTSQMINDGSCLVVSGGFFLHDNTSEFLKSTVQTTLDSMVPLSQVLSAPTQSKSIYKKISLTGTKEYI